MLKRLFLGFSPNEVQTTQLLGEQNAIESDGNRVPAANLHLTLAFLGQVNEYQQACLIEQLNHHSTAAKFKRFNVILNEFVHWQKASAICLIGKALDPNLIDLQRRSVTLATDIGLHCSEHDFIPHITLYRKAKRLTAAPPDPLYFAPDTLHLYQSVSTHNGVRYPIVSSWSLIDEP
ncbi:RNA 2',3'-cyclic phosphodiesterase [Shewanella colwelliana]|uniref:RNA 2',3'-cyclic phosphodiesterase n=1 Tax=Shewanella colwelliana TaxID=23 RepID=UPI001BC74070|nr:RNA 2',3'-cyclic phosphodiesterase [Shewanella colwelliana]GIU17658.1 RNA 2',3'-cyclic phosphodiesterase [Shewanella colwelliana]